MLPKYPIYIPTKGRHESRLTIRALERMGVPYFAIVEESQLQDYESVIPRERILILDPKFQAEYETCDALGDSKSKGPGPARNFAWAHAIENGHAWHWVMDDNIKCFYRMRENKRIEALDGAIFAAMEELAGRYKNVAMAGPNYHMFAMRHDMENMPPFIINTRIYSCNLIRNDVPYRWRGRYNEDTIISLDMLKGGWCTMQFYAFLQGKVRTQTLPGGNTAEFYGKEGTLAKSIMQKRVHPDCSEVVWKYGRVHHHVDYSRFKHQLPILRDGIQIPSGPDEFGMILDKAAPAR